MMKTVLICHAGDKLNRIGLARWLASFSDLSVVVISETKQRKWKRIRREIKRVGPGRFPDVLAFRLYYRLLHASRDAQWEEGLLHRLVEAHPGQPASGRVLYTSSPNSDEALNFIRNVQPDIMIARCKTLLKESIFSIPSRGTYVMHPGICPEYRNAHGCFWALVNNDYKRVGMTLLRVDKGVDTGAVYGYYSYDFDPLNDSHAIIQHRVVFDNLDALRQKLEEICAGRAQVIDTSGRSSATWGQPWLSRYLLWKWKFKRQKKENESHIASVS
jgi:methionyl-tRNA formyltransferase